MVVKIWRAAKRSLGAVLKMCGDTGVTIRSAAEQLIMMVRPSSQTFLMLRLSPLVEGPMMANTRSSSMSCLAKEMAFSGLPAESLMISSMVWPLMPPAALISSASMRSEREAGPPRKAAGPVSARMAPILITSARAAGATSSRVRANSPAERTSLRNNPFRFMFFLLVV